jgi:hypothetical protein
MAVGPAPVSVRPGNDRLGVVNPDEAGTPGLDRSGAQSIALSLVSHTNAGKTTLARTLLQRDVGEVRDAAHVTEWAEDHLLLRSPQGDELLLWDTPGFGDSLRLLQRVQRDGTALGWFLSEVWDRWRNRAFWSSQQALRHVKEHSDVVLYLVNASESPQAAPYVAAEMQLLAWMGKPVIVLLNQLGAGQDLAAEAADVQAWRDHLGGWPHVRQVIPLDAFARCWVQESVLWGAVAQVLPAAQQAPMERLHEAWRTARWQTFEDSARALSRTLAHVASTRVALDAPQGLGESMRALSSRLGHWALSLAGRGSERDDALSEAQGRLMAALDQSVREGTAELLGLHGLSGQVQGEILERVARQMDVAARIDEGSAALWGGALTGALAGLKADLATGGLTLGGGLLAGGLIGALGAAGVARGINVMRGGGPAWVGWSPEALMPMVEAAMLRYLAVAHFGRGRGDWAPSEAPGHWQPRVQAALAADRSAWLALWKGRDGRLQAPPDEVERLAQALQPRLTAALRSVLQQLYPDASVWGDAQAAGAPSPAAP